MQLFQRRRWIHPEHLEEGLGAFVAQLTWINTNTGLAMSGWEQTGPEDDPGAILATTTFEDHGWFLGEVARLQTLGDYAPINETTAALTVGQDAFERWRAPTSTPETWSLGQMGFRQMTIASISHAPDSGGWKNIEGSEGYSSLFLNQDLPSVAVDADRVEDWQRIL
jgi:hypothetical protein|tara:strand:- start:557 stop:1057 length:501 start_codon:yes stop_codon:yes gene_type:complete